MKLKLWFEHLVVKKRVRQGAQTTLGFKKDKTPHTSLTATKITLEQAVLAG